MICSFYSFHFYTLSETLKKKAININCLMSKALWTSVHALNTFVVPFEPCSLWIFHLKVKENTNRLNVPLQLTLGVTTVGVFHSHWVCSPLTTFSICSKTKKKAKHTSRFMSLDNDFYIPLCHIQRMFPTRAQAK